MSNHPVRLPNPLGLAVLGMLHERPMHPHAIATELKSRGLDRNFKLTTGTLYDAVRTLEKAGWISEVETIQVGARPPRTVYGVTQEGREIFIRWIDELVRQPSEEFPRFLAAVTYLGALGPARALDALNERARILRSSVNQLRADHQAALATLAAEGKPRLFVLEAEYAIWITEAELRWVEQTAQEIAAGSLPWPNDEAAIE